MTIPTALLTSDRQDYETPRFLFQYIQTFLGVTFVVDFAASDGNALCPMYYTKERSAFNHSWVVPPMYVNAAGWCNPPYGDKTYPVRDWVARALPQYNYVYLLPCNKMDQPWVWGVRHRAAWVKIIGRIQYTVGGVRPTHLDKLGRTTLSGNSQGSTLLCMGPDFIPGTTRYINLKEIPR